MRKIYSVNKFKFLGSLILFFSLNFFSANAQSVWNGSVSSDWNIALNWTPAGIPVKTNDVVIPTGTTNSLSINTKVECKNITINTGANVAFVTGSSLPGFIGVYGNFVNSGTITNSSSAGFNIYIQGGAPAQSISSTGTMATSKLAVFFGASVTLLTDIKVNQFLVEDNTDPNLLLRDYTAITTTSPNVYLGSNKLTVGTYFYQYGNFHQQTGTLELNNGADSPYLTAATFFAETGLTWYNNTDPASTTIFVTGGVTYNNLQLSLNGVTYAEIGLPNEVDNTANGAITCTGNMTVDGTGTAGLAFDLTVNGNMTIGNGILFNPNGMVNTTYSNLTLKGDLVDNGNFNGTNGPSPTGGGTVTFAGTTTQHISGTGSEIYFALVVNNTSAAGVVLNHDFQVSRTMTMQAGNFNLNGSNINFRGNGTLVGETETTRIFGATGTIFTTARTGAQSTGNIAGFGATITSPLTTSIIITRGHTIQNVNGKPSISRYFDIASTPDAALNASFGFAYFDKEKNAIKEGTLTMFRSNDGGLTWNQADCSQATTVRDTNANTVTQTAIQTFATRWTLSPVLAKISGTAFSNQSICKGSTAVLLVKNYGGNTFQWQDSSSVTTWANIPASNNDTIFRSPTVTTKYRVIVSTTTCSDTSNVVKVTLLPDAVAGTAGSDKTFCSGQSTSVKLTGSTGTIQWQDSIAGGTWVNIPAATAATYNTPVLNQTNFYRAKVTVGTCFNYSNTVTITVNPSVTGGTVSANDSICNGGIVNLSVTGNTGNIQWQDSTAGGTWVDLAGANTPTFTSSALTQTTYFRVAASNITSTCFSKSNVVTIKVIPLVVTGIAGNDTTICSGNSIKLKLTGNSGAIQWQDSLSGGAWVNITGATAASYNTIALNTTTYYRARVSISFCNSFTNTVTATVNPSAIAGTTSPDTLLCIGNGTTLKLSGSSGNVQWQDSSKTSSGTWNNIAGAMSTTYTTPSLTDTVYYRALLSNGTATCFDTSKVIAVNIIPGITVGVAGNDSSICSGNSAMLKLTGSLGNIQWQDSSMVSGMWKDIAGARATTYKTAALNDTTYYRARVYAGSGCADTTNIVKIAVFPTPVAGIAGRDTAICINNSVTLNLTGSTGNIQWQNAAANAGPWSDIAGEINPSITTPTLTDTTYYRAVVKNMASLSCYDTSNTVKVTVNPNPVAGTAGNDTTICSSNKAILKLAGSFGSIQWQDSSSTTGMWQNVTAATTTPYTTAALMDTTYYRAVLSTGGCSNDTSNIVVVNVKLNASAGVTSKDTSICTGGTATITLTGTVGNIQWRVSPDRVAFADSVGQVNDTLLVTQQSPVRYYKATITNNGCIANSDTVKVNVDPVTIAGTAGNDTTLCKGDSTLLVLTGSRGKIQWQSSNDNVLFTDTLAQINDSLKVSPNSTKYFRAVVKSGACSSALSNTVKVTVFPKTVAGTTSPSISICKGSSTTIRLTASAGNIQWQTSNDSIAFADTLGATADTIIVSPSGKRFYRAFLTSGVCSSDSSSIVTINTDNAPVAGTATTDHTVCAGTAVKLFVTGGTGSIQWQTSADNIVFADSTGATIDSIVVSPQSTRYYRALSKNGVCTPAASNAVKITVNPTSVAGIITGTDTICKGSSKTIVLKNSVGNKQWQVSNDGIAFADSVGAIIDSIKVSPAATRYYRAYAKSGLCSADTSAIVKITIFSPNAGGIATASDVCAGSSTKLILTGYTGNIQWQKSLDSTAWANLVPGSTTPLTIAPVVTTFYRAVLTDGGVCKPDTSNKVKVKVVAPAVADSIVADSPHTCVGNSTRIRLVGNTGTVQWQSSPDATVFSNIPGATATTYYTPALTDTIYYRAVVKNAMCYDTSKTVKVTVRPAVQMLNIIGTDSVCIGSNAVLNIKMVKDSVLKWLQSTDNFSYTDVPLSTNDSTITPAPTVTTYYKVILTNTTCNDTTAAFKVVVSPLSIAGSAMSSGTHCTGTVTTLSINGYLGKLQWQSSTNGTFYTNVSNGTLATLNVSPLVSTFYRVYVKSGKCSVAYTNVIKLTVVQGSVAGTAIAAKATVCIGNPANITLNGYTGAIQWQRANAAAGPFVNILINSTQPVYNGAVNTPTYFRAIVKNASCDSVLSNVLFINTVPGVNAGTAKALRDTICVGDSAKLKLSYSKGPIQWQRSSTGTTWQDITGATDSNYVSLALSSTIYYRAVVNNNACSDSTASYRIVVNTPPLASQITSSQNLCLGENATITLSSHSGNIQWQASRDTNFVSLRNEVLSTVVVTPYITTFYRAKVTTVGCKKNAYTNVDTVKVFPLSVAGFVNIDRTVRPGVSALVSVKSYVGNIQWQSSLDSINFTDIAGEHAAVLETSPKRNTYYRAIINSASCVSITNIVEVTVDFAIFSISPVPSKDYITVSFNLPENQLITVKVFDMLGKVVMEKQVNAIQGYNELKIDITGYASGMNYLQIENESTLIKGKFIKE